MLDINMIRENPEIVKKSLEIRQMDTTPVDRILQLDLERRSALNDTETLKAQRNSVSKEISQIKDAEERKKKIEAMRVVGDQISDLDQHVKKIEEELKSLLLYIPNIPNPEVPYGISDAENVVLRQEGEKKAFDFEPIPHWDIGTNLGIIDFERGVKLTGTRVYVLNGQGARLQRALIEFRLDLRIRRGYN